MAFDKRGKGRYKVEGGPSRRWLMRPADTPPPDFGCFAGQSVRVTRGLELGRVLHGTVVAEYPSHIVIAYEAPDGSTHTTSLTKASLLCGDAEILGETGSVLRPRADDGRRPADRRQQAMEDYSLI